jgi:hypothetical protein
VLTARERRDEARLLLRRSEVEQWERDGARVHRHGDADAGIRTRELFEREDVRHEVSTCPAVFLRNACPHQPELCELDEELAREPPLTIPLSRVRLDLRPRKVARKRLHFFLLNRRLEVHARTICRRLHKAGARPYYEKCATSSFLVPLSTG